MANILNIASYNLHGLNQGKPLLENMCDRFDIIAVQEHWLSSCDLDKLIYFHSDFQGYAWSAMTDKLESTILVGRPYGGLGLLVNKSLNVKVTPVACQSNSRSVVVSLTFPDGYTLLLSIVYFPCYKTDLNYQSDLLECLGFIEQCVSCSNYDGLVILGDMNFELDPSSTGYQLFKSFADELHLTCCADLGFGSFSYTYYQESSGRHSCIDHIVVDTSLKDRVRKYEVFDCLVNMSDHYPVFCSLDISDCQVTKQASYSDGTKGSKPRIRRWDKGDLAGYYSMSYEMLQKVHIPKDIATTKCNTVSCTHWNCINDYYKSLVNALTTAANYNIPFVHSNTFKSFWTSELSELKEASYNAHQLWILCGKPNSGIVNDLRRESKYKYKLALRQAMRQEELQLDDEISQLYLKKDLNKFWMKWNSKFNKPRCYPSNIGGHNKSSDIAVAFSESFSDVYFDSYSDSSSFVKCLDNVHSAIRDEDCILDIFNVADIEKGVNALKNGKASGVDGLSKENITNCHPAIIVHLKLLFNMIYLHGFVPDDFGKGITIPVLKDKLGDVSSVDNYRPITISPVISKIFEYCLLFQFEGALDSSHLQFGFKNNSSCSHAIFLLKEVTDYFVSHGSNVYMASLDARKAFDRVNHVKLFNILINKGLPGRLVKIIIDWYGKTFSVVRWNDCFSESRIVKSGIRQGGILSPIFFNIYMDVLLNTLKSSEYGCHLGKTFLGCIAYADDLILLSASVCNLQKMLTICDNVGRQLDILFNAKKSFLFKVGKMYKADLEQLQIGNSSIQWSTNIKYLGLNFCSGKCFTVDTSSTIRKLYAAANAVFSLTKYVSAVVKLSLIDAYVLPIMTYALEAVSLSRSQYDELSVCWNNLFRRIFGMHKWESVKALQYYCGSLDFTRLCDLRRLRFLHKISACRNVVLKECFYRTDVNYLCYEYNVNFSLSLSVINHSVYSKFGNICGMF